MRRRAGPWRWRFSMMAMLLGLSMPLLLVQGTACAVGVVLEDFRLYLPWVAVGPDLYWAEMTPVPGEGPVRFTLSDSGRRTTAPAEGGRARFYDDGLLQIPLLSFQGELFAVDLQYEPGAAGESPVFGLSRVALQPEREGRGRIVKATRLEVMTPFEVSAALLAMGVPFRATYGVSLYRIIYETITPFNQLSRASGLLAVPEGLRRPAPLLGYQHGTQTRRSDAPSSTGKDLPSLLGAATGYVVATADYLGLGSSEGLHPFVHAKSLASAVIDMLRAARTWCGENGVRLSKHLFLAGYSEGGYATMAALKEIEAYYREEFSVTAAAPAAGPYDLSGTMLAVAVADKPAPNPFYFPYVLLAYQQIYGFADDPADLFAPPYDETVPPLFDGTRDAATINAALPAVQKEMFSEALLQALVSDNPHPVKAALRQNDVYQWVPTMPMRLYHCTDDQDVPFENSRIADSYFTAHGAPDVKLISLTAGGHVACAVPVMLGIKLWFDGFLGDGD